MLPAVDGDSIQDPFTLEEVLMTQLLQLLLLDDEPIVGKRLTPALVKIGCEVEVFQDPHAALARIKEKEFDIVVTDIRMDEMDGMQVLEYVRDKSPRTRVIMITGYAMTAMAREAMEKGAFDFIAKPFKPDDLRQAIIKAAKALGSSIDIALTGEVM
jgi:DNA-binding NtrC family response regulator